jgi:putative endonuclease
MRSRDQSLRKAIKREGRFFVYIVECRDRTYYTGYTQNLEERVSLHNSGNGAKYLRGKLPVKLVYTKEYRYYKNALSAERRIKKLTREQKLNLVRIYAENKQKIAVTKTGGIFQ